MGETAVERDNDNRATRDEGEKGRGLRDPLQLPSCGCACGLMPESDVYCHKSNAGRQSAISWSASGLILDE